MKSSALPVALAALVSGVLVVAAQAQSSRPERWAARRIRASHAAPQLGGHLRSLAVRHRRSAAGLRALMARDRDLWVDAQARLVYRCEQDLPAPAAAAQSEEGPAAAAPYPLESTFTLHSRPGSSRKIYLDFDGHTTTGTWWNEDTGGAPIVSAPFDQDGNPASFSAGELEAIQQCWQRVAEDFAPFELDVTTQDPGVDGLRRTSAGDGAFGVRVVISPTDDWFGQAGGVAYLSVFESQNTGEDLPAFVFSQNIQNSEKNIAEAASHEVGHTLGLGHDGTSSAQYYSGHGSWAPIMGASYSRSISQWSRGEYAGARNADQTNEPDDFVLMQANGALYRSDDHGNTVAAATVLTGVAPSASGLIERSSDKDFFRFTTGAGSITLSAGTSPRGPNLDIKLELYDSNGALITTADPAGLPASLVRTVAAGTYYVAVDGVGAGDPATNGYSDYGSIGDYTLSASLVAVANGSLTLTAPNGGETWSVGALQTVSWTSSGISGNVKLDYSTNGGATWISITGSTLNDGAESWTVPNAPTNQARIRVSTLDGAVRDSSNASFSIAAAAPAGDTYEVDNTPAAAKTLAAGATQSRSLHVPGDEDWAVFTLGTRSSVTLTTDGATGDTVLELYGPGSASTLIAQDDDGGNGLFSLLQRTGAAALAAGTYYVRVRNKTSAGTLSSYTLNLQVSTAASLTVTSPNGGENWAAGTVRTITWTGAGVSGSVRIDYSTNSGAAWIPIANSVANDGAESWTVPNTPSTACLIRVMATDGSVSDVSNSVFTIPAATGDAYEVDDSAAAAKPIAAGQSQSRSIHAAGNADWAKIVLTKKSRVTLTTAGVTGGDTVLYLYRSNGTSLVASNDNYRRGSRYSRIANRRLAAGTYYARVIGKGSSTLSAYTLTMTAR